MDNFIVAEDPLLNFAVLRNIFKFLSDRDVEKCSCVSQYWRSVADPFIFSRFDIHLGRGYLDDSEADVVVIKERARYNRKIWTKSESDFVGVETKLEEVLLNYKVSARLSIHADAGIRKTSTQNFLKKFGHLIVDLDVIEAQPLNFNLFSELLLTSLPNLQSLTCSGLQLEEDSNDANFHPNLPENKHQQLKKIYLHPRITFQDLVKILTIAPKLQEIHRLPLAAINAITVTQMGQAVKSLSGGFYLWEQNFVRNGETVVTAFEKLAQLQPKLAYFQFLSTSNDPGNENTMELIKPLIFSILQSSCDSLHSLNLRPSESYGFQPIPQLTALKTLTFISQFKGGFFPQNISLKEIFPNVNKVCIGMMCKNDLESLLPENIVGPWGVQIKELTLRVLDSNSVPYLERRFPSIEKLTILEPPQSVRALLLAVLGFCSHLKSLTIAIRYGCVPLYFRRQRDLDCDLTGLDETTLDQLLDPARRMDFSEDKINKFKDWSIFRLFTELKKLKLVLHECQNRMDLITPVANEFGFELIPGLKVTLAIMKERTDVEEIRAGLLPLLNVNKNIEIEEGYVDKEWWSQ